MTDRLNELEGRIEAVSCLLLRLTATLEMNDSIVGTDITRSLRRKADSIVGIEPDVLLCSQRAMRHLADELDDARMIRQKRAH